MPWLSEPATTLTDYLLAAVTAAFALHLLQRGIGGSGGATAWGAAFGATAVAAGVGGTVHGFGPRLRAGVRRALWLTTLVLTGLVGFCLIAGAALALSPAPVRHGVIGLAVVKLAIALFVLLRRGDFRFVLYDSGISLLVVLLLVLYAAARGPVPAGWWIAGGVALSLAAAAVQASGVRLHRHFNHNDLFHVVQIGAAYLLYRAGLVM